MKNMFTWYPPAETYIPMSALVRALLPGPDDFAMDMKRYFGVNDCVLGISGRALLNRLLVTLKNHEGNKRKHVLIPAYTCYSVAASIVRAGLKIACYDLQPHTFEPDMDSVKAHAGPDTLAIIGQHLFGIPTPMEGLASVSRQAGAYLIEDAAQSFGGTFHGVRLGTFGDFGLFSFGRGKPLPLGTGGVLIGKTEVLNDLALDEIGSGYLGLIMVVLSRLFSNRNVYGLLEALPLGLGKTVFDPDFSIWSMPKIIRKLGKHSLNAIGPINAHRNRIVGIYRGILGDTKTPPIPLPPNGSAVFTRFPFMASIKPITKTLFRLGVRRMYPKAIPDEPAIRPHCVPGSTSHPGASKIAEKLITLPTHMGISIDMAKEIAKEVEDWV